MKKTLMLLTLFLTSNCTPLPAQNFDLETKGIPAISLDGQWRFHTGDNSAWAKPGFDDSHWALLDSTAPWTDQGYKGYGGIAWYRFHATIPTSMAHVSIYLPKIFTCYEVFANGVRVGGFGKMPPNIRIYSGGGDYRLYPLPPTISASGSIEIALRIWQAPSWAAYEDGGPLRPGGLIGDSIELARVNRAQWRGYWFYLMGYEVLGFIELLASLGGIILFCLRRNEPEYLWFSLILLFQSATITLDLWTAGHVWPDFAGDILAGALAGGLSLATLAFYRALFKPKRTWLVTLSVICAFAAILTSPLAALFPRVLTISLTTLIEALLWLPISVWIIVIFITAVRRNSQDARLLVLPVFLSLSITLYGQLQTITFTLGWQHIFMRPNIVLTNQPFRVELSYITDLLFLFAVLTILILRFSRTRGQEERYASEVGGARKVQQFLIPEDLPKIPGLTIESDYRPAREVGGDFFQVIPDLNDDGGLIIVGDVAGKGLEAGMLATLLVGATRTAANFTTDPAVVLATLNNRLCGKGNATCLVMRIEASGAATLVNAGHLPPYLNGVELPMEGALPLGTIPNIEFPVLTFQIDTGDALTLISDGILEAQKPDGELFGFERIAEHLRQSTSAARLATAAQDFGQSDDITVLTITRPDPGRREN